MSSTQTYYSSSLFVFLKLSVVYRSFCKSWGVNVVLSSSAASVTLRPPVGATFQPEETDSLNDRARMEDTPPLLASSSWVSDEVLGSMDTMSLELALRYSTSSGVPRRERVCVC